MDAYARTFENSSLDEDLVTRGFLYSSFLAAGGMTIVFFNKKKTFSTLYGTSTIIYFSNNYFNIVAMQEYFCVLWQGKKAQALPKLHKYVHNHGSCGILLKCIGLLR